MSSLYRNRYRIESDRLQGYNYGLAGAYYITICIKDRVHHFGEILNGEMKLSDLGLLLQDEWLKTPAIRPDMNITLDEFIIMPDHFHAIIIIGGNRYNDYGKCRFAMANKCRFAMHCESTFYRNYFGPQSKNLSSIIRGVKMKITTYARINSIDFAWQSRFYDHIIRDYKEMYRIRNYIINNPKNWEDDDHKTIRGIPIT